VLGSGDHIRNPSVRGKATTIMTAVAKMKNYSQRIEKWDFCVRNMIPSCVRVFTAVEKTKQSYYDIRMHLKYQLRMPIMELFEKLMELVEHKNCLKRFAEAESEDFLKFTNLMINDATYQLEEGLDTLLEVRKREAGEQPDESGAAGVGVHREVDEQEDMNADGQDMFRRSRHDPKEHCRTYMKMGHRTLRTLWSMSREAPQVVIGAPIVLQQMLQNCLNTCLDRLVGPKCLELKAKNAQRQDFEEYEFHPKKLLTFLAEMYVALAREDRDKVVHIVGEDGRNYKPQTFRKAIKILARENFIPAAALDDFRAFVDYLIQSASAQQAAMDAIEIPDEYLDPIMAEIMSDPVLLPTSKNIMDRKVIERQIMSTDEDPFNRQALKKSDLIPQDELRKEIHEFCAKHNIKLDDD